MLIYCYLPHASKVLFLAMSVTLLVCFVLFVAQISGEPLNGFAPNLQGRRVWSLARMSLNVKVIGQGHRDKNALSPPAATEWSRLPHDARSRRAHCVAAGMTTGTCIMVFGKTPLW